MKQRRVCLIGPATNVHVQRWAAALSARGWRVSLISTVPVSTPLPASLHRLPLFNLPTATPDMRAVQRVVTVLRGWARLPGLIAALDPQLVHLHSLPTPVAVPFLRRVKPLIVSAWGSDVVQRDPRKARWYPLLLDHAAALTATSPYLAGVMAQYLRAPRPIQIVPFGVDVDQFVPADQPGTIPSIGSLRHLEPIYGLDLLIDALPIIKNIVPAVQCYIGGAGRQHATLIEQAAQRDVAHAVTLHGRIDHDRVPAFLQSLDVFVMPSRAESFGVAALEAQACGVPVVATAVGGLPDVVRDGLTGRIVPPNDPHTLAVAVIDLLTDRQKRVAMAQAAREWVCNRYNWHRNVDQMTAIYESI